MLYYKNYSELDLYLHKINRNTKFAVVYKKNITAVSVRWRHWIDHADTKQKPLMKPDCLIGVVPQPTDSRLSETTDRAETADHIHKDSIDWYAPYLQAYDRKYCRLLFYQVSG